MPENDVLLEEDDPGAPGHRSLQRIEVELPPAIPDVQGDEATQSMLNPGSGQDAGRSSSQPPARARIERNAPRSPRAGGGPLGTICAGSV